MVVWIRAIARAAKTDGTHRVARSLPVVWQATGPSVSGVKLWSLGQSCEDAGTLPDSIRLQLIRYRTAEHLRPTEYICQLKGILRYRDACTARISYVQSLRLSEVEPAEERSDTVLHTVENKWEPRDVNCNGGACAHT